MQVIWYLILLVVGGLLSFVIKPKVGLVYCIASIYISLALLISVSLWLFYFGGIKNSVITGILSFVTTWGSHAGHFMLGYLTISIWSALRVKDVLADNYQLKKLIRSTLWAMTILTGNAFIMATIGKAENMAYMLAFFKASGYANWFLYFIMAAESLGGLGVLLHFKLKTGPLAATGLLLIMVGAVYTHWHNGDPFSDSYAAVSQFITLSIMLFIYYLQQQADNGPAIAVTSNY
jgi:putative oxidoreductase